MFGFSNSDSILGVLAFDFVLCLALGMFIDRNEGDVALEYQEYVGCLCAAPMLFVVNLIGIGVLVVFNWLGILGPWWTWTVGIMAPYVLVIFVLVASAREEAKVKKRQEQPTG